MSRRPKVFAAMALAVAVGACSSKATRSATTARRAAGYRLDGGAFVVTMSAKPSKQNVDLGVAGFTSVAWTITRGNAIEQVLEERVPGSLGKFDETLLASTFASVVAGMATRGGGTVTTNEPLAHPAGLARKAVITVPGGPTLFVAAVARGQLVIIVSAGGIGSSEHAAYQAMLDSLRFR